MAKFCDVGAAVVVAVAYIHVVGDVAVVSVDSVVVVAAADGGEVVAADGCGEVDEVAGRSSSITQSCKQKQVRKNVVNKTKQK